MAERASGAGGPSCDAHGGGDGGERRATVDELTAQLVGQTDHGELASIGAALTDAQRELDEHETTWLELAALQDG